MTKPQAHLEDALRDWNEVRWNSVEFIKSLGTRRLNTKLPRPGLDTFCKHFQEMIDAEDAYTRAIQSGRMSFDNMRGNDEYVGDESAKNLLTRMKKADAALRATVRSAKPSAKVHWPGLGRRSVGSLLANLASHEMFHIGQLVGFCYATGVPLPKALVKAWFLSPPKSDSNKA